MRAHGTSETSAPAIKPAPAFLIGCRRAGASLVRRLLDAHERIACPPESKFISAFYEFAKYPQVKPALVNLGVSSPDLFRLLRAVCDGIFSSYTRRHGKARWIDHTPSYYQLIDFIDRIFAGEALYLFIVRHPFDNILSLQEQYPGTWDTGDAEIRNYLERYKDGKLAWAKYWVEVNQRVVACAAALPERSLIFKYEDLVLDTERVLGGILALMGEEHSPALVGRAFGGLDAAAIEAGRCGGSAGIHPHSIVRWQSWPESEQAALWSVVGEVAAALGYAAPRAGQKVLPVDFGAKSEIWRKLERSLCR